MTIFDLVYLAAATPAAPYLLFKWMTDARFSAGLSERLGFGARRSGSVWFHGASVGEINAIRSLGRLLERDHPLAVTTMTAQGRENAARLFPDAGVTFAPLDWSACVKRYAARVRPKLIVLVEQELWPNMILNAPCPVALVNARMTERSAENYRRLGGVFRRVIRRIDLVLAQNEEYAARYRSLGARKVEVAGNLKFDALPKVDEAAERARYRALIGEPLLVAGSTSAPEEEIILDAYSTLLKQFPSLRLAIAPRHLERLADVLKTVQSKGFTPRRLSEGAARNGVAVLDTMGELYKLYCAATATFVGGSFSGRGGQSLIEPASLGKAMVTGPDLRNFADVADRLEALGVLKIAPSPAAVAPRLAEFLAHPELGEPGRALIKSSSGCTDQVAQSLRRLLGAT